MGLDVYIEGLDQPSGLYPDHLFRIGYFRSSYNHEGFNFVAGLFDNPDLYEIFNQPRDQPKYRSIPDWVSCQKRAKGAVKLWQLKAPKETLSINVGLSSPDNIESLIIGLLPSLVKGLEPEKDLIEMIPTPIQEDIKIITPSDYIWYIQASEIVLETLDYILAGPDKGDGLELVWSA
jgi:hypothetical protein